MRGWAEVRFTAIGGQTADFLQRAAIQNFKLRNIDSLFGGVSATCMAERYAMLSKVAKTCHVKLHVIARKGLYFHLRGFFAKKGLWLGLACFVFFLVCNRNLLWQIEDSNLTTGQQARIEQVLWESCGIAPGAYLSESLLASGEAALLSYQEEFSWASLNFVGGRLTVEVNPAIAVPEIAMGAAQDLLARAEGEVVSINVKQGTAAVHVGDVVTVGQVLITAQRLEHDQETLAYEPTAGEVRAKLSTHYTASVAYQQSVSQPIPPLQMETERSLFAFGQTFALSEWLSLSDLWDGLNGAHEETEQIISTRRVQLEWLGFHFPVTIIEENILHCTEQAVFYTEAEALARARMECSEQLYAVYPDAEVVGYQETIQANEGTLYYEIDYQVVANICSLLE